jgi:hypothetical protein
MKPSRILDKPFLAGVAALAVSVVAGSLSACSSDSTPAPDVMATNDPSTPERPSDSSGNPTQNTPDSGSTTAPGDCKRAAPSNACGVSPQCGCAPTETCDIVDTYGTAKCVPAGDARMGHPCETTDGCALGLTCIFGICHAFCDDPTTTCSQPGTGSCVQIKSTSGDDVPNLAICRIECDLADPMSCGGTTSAGVGVCRVDDKGETECQSGGTQKENETCSPTEECGPGLGCTSSGSKSTCKRWCRVGQDDCGAGKKCNGFAPEVRVRDVVYGACS